MAALVVYTDLFLSMPDFVGQEQEKNTQFPTQLRSRNLTKHAASSATKKWSDLTAALLSRAS